MYNVYCIRYMKNCNIHVNIYWRGADPSLNDIFVSAVLVPNDGDGGGGQVEVQLHVGA